MREIKFRAWDKLNEIMCIVTCIGFNSQEVFMGEPAKGPISMKDVELMQSTGLTDKNGKEIYDCDIVRCWNGNKSFIWYDEGFWRIGKKGRIIKEWEFKDMEVIGTFYDNPELLKS